MRKFKLISHHFALYIWILAVGYLLLGFMVVIVGGTPIYLLLGFSMLVWAIWASFPPKEE